MSTERKYKAGDIVDIRRVIIEVNGQLHLSYQDSTSSWLDNVVNHIPSPPPPLKVGDQIVGRTSQKVFTIHAEIDEYFVLVCEDHLTKPRVESKTLESNYTRKEDQ